LILNLGLTRCLARLGIVHPQDHFEFKREY
jgi:hypothetical protein